MEQTPLFGLQSFEEEKVIQLNDSVPFSPLSKSNSLIKTSQDLQPLHQLEREEKTIQVSKAGRQRRHSLDEDRNMNRGHWLLEENKKYHWFLQIHYKHFVNRHMRRMDKIFKTMETFIGTRQAQQCRSHHQKMQKKYHDFVAIITNLRLQHYYCEDIEPLAADMQANEIVLIQKLATIGELNQQSLLPVNNIEFKERRKSVHQKPQQLEIEALINPSIPEEDQKQIVQVPSAYYHPINMLEQSNLNIGELMLFHEKDDISGLFNFHRNHDE